MKFWVKIALALAATGLFIGGYYGTEYLDKKEAEEKKLTEKALPFDASKVRRISVKNLSEQVVMERDGEKSQWKIVQPSGVNADQDAISGFLTTLEGLTTSMDLAGTEKVLTGSAAEKHSFGLDAPRLVVELGLDDKTQRSLAIGSDMNVGTKTGDKLEAVSVYAASSEKKNVQVMSSSSFEATKKGLADFRSKKLGSFVVSDVKNFSLTQKDGTQVALTKSGDDWKLTKPRDMLADGNNVRLYLDRISDFHADKVIEKKDFTPEKMSALGLNPPVATLTLMGAENKILQSIGMGHSKENVAFVLPDGAVGIVAGERWGDLSPELKFFRDRRVMRGVPMADVATLRTVQGKEFRREGANWYAVTPSGAVPTASPAPLSPGLTPTIGQPNVKTAVTLTPTVAGRVADSNVAQFFGDWEFLTADDVIDGPEAKNLSAYGLDKPRAHFWFGFSDPKRSPEEILVGNRVPNREKMVYIKRANGEAVYVVEANWLDTLAKIEGSGTETKTHK